MKIIRTDMYGRECPEKVIASGLTRESAEAERDRLNAPLDEGSIYWHIVTEESYQHLTAEMIYGVASDT